MPTTTSSYFTKFAKYAFIAFALTGTAYYAYKQGYLQEDDFDGTNLSPLEVDDEKEEEEDNTEEEEDKEETFDDESVVELETANLKRRGARGKPPRSPPPPLMRNNRVKEAEELEGKNGTTSRSEREARKLSKGHRNDMKRGFLNEKNLSSSGLFGDGDDEEDPEKDEDEEEVPKKATTTTKESRKRELAMKSPLQLIYRNIRKDLLISKSFDVSAIEATRSLFHFEPFPGVGVWPVKYDDMKMFPMKSSCSRLVVLSVFDDAPSLAASGTAIVSELSKLMMGFGGDLKYDEEEEEEENEGNATKVKQRPMFVCNRAQYHVTMFFFSRPIEGMTREEPVEFLIDGSGVADAQREVLAKKNDEEIEPPSTPPPSARTMEKQPSIPKGLGETVLPDKPKPRVKRSVAQNYDRVLSPPTPMSKIKPPSAISSAENLAHASTPISSTQSKFKRSASGAILDEATKAQEVLQTCEPVELVVDRVVLATSGALLLCFDDVDDSLKKCRASLASNAVGVRGVQQTSTAHCTLARILPNAGDEHLSDFELKQIDQLLTKWTKKLKGAKMTCPKAWYVREERFSSVDGDKVRLRFKE
ncbi:unnamed protein product [Bathycoccus prasinos]